MRNISYRHLLIFLLLGASCASKPLYIHQQPSKQYEVTQQQPQDSNLVKWLQPYKKGVDTQMQVIVGHTDIPLTKAQPESTLGNFVADAQLVYGRIIDPKVDAAVSNYGGIRLAYIEPGPITRGKVYELMPFDNMLTIAEVPGTVLKQFCDFMASKKGWPVSGLSFTIKDKIATDIMIGGVPLNEHRFYKLAISDYIARGGDNCDFLVGCRKRFTSIFIRDAMMAYITELEKASKPLHPSIENRIRYAD